MTRGYSDHYDDPEWDPEDEEYGDYEEAVDSKGYTVLSLWYEDEDDL